MNNTIVKDLMIPVAEYPLISSDATLGEAQIALESAQKAHNKTHHRYQTLLVKNNESQIIGKISLMDLLVAIEPKYKRFGDMALLSRFGYSPGFYDYILKNIDLLQNPLDGLCRKAAVLKVKDIMSEHQINAFIEESASLNQAIHQLVISNQQSLLVTRNKEIVGVLRLADVAEALGEYMRSCVLEEAQSE